MGLLAGVASDLGTGIDLARKEGGLAELLDAIANDPRFTPPRSTRWKRKTEGSVHLKEKRPPLIHNMPQKEALVEWRQILESCRLNIAAMTLFS